MKRLIFFISLFVSLSVFGQDVRPAYSKTRAIKLVPDKQVKTGVPDTLDLTGRHNFEHLDISDGLSSHYTRRIWFDHRQYMWVGTNGGGISVYDGKEFTYIRTTHGLSHDIVWDFEEDDEGRVWIATDDGVSIFDGNSFEYINEEDGLGNIHVWSLMKDDQGRIWIGTAGGGVSVYDHGELTNYTDILGDTTVQVYDICQDKSGTIWFATHFAGVFSFRDGQFENHRFENGETNIVYAIQAVEIGGHEEIWAGTRNSLMRYNNGKWTFTDPAELPFRAIFDIQQDKEGYIWVATYLGIMKWSEESSMIFRKEQGLFDNFVSCMAEDKWGTMWIGYRNFGISHYWGNRFVHFGKTSGLKSNVQSYYIAKDGTMWMGLEDNGIVKYEDGKFLIYGPDQGFNWGHINGFGEDEEGNLWIGQFKPGGIIRFDGTYFDFFSFTTEDEVLMQVHEFQYFEEKLWISGFGKLAFIQNDSLHLYSHEQTFVDHHMPLDLFITQEDALMISSNGGGVAYIKDGINVLLKEDSGLMSNSIFSIDQDKHGNYWFVTNGMGVCVLRAGAYDDVTKPLEWMYIKIEDGLSSNEVHRVFIQDDGDAWICTGQGLNEIVLNGADVFEEKHEINFYGYNEGFTGIESDFAPVQDSKGIMWFISKGEAAKFDPYHDEHTSTSPAPVLTGIKLKLKDVDWQSVKDAEYGTVDNWNNIPATLSLPYSLNHIHFEFNGVTFADPNGSEFSWRLHGFDEEWSPWSKMTNATYANLPANEYEFQLKCRDTFGNVSEPLIYKFTVRKAFWQTWWFRIVVAVVILWMIYGIIKWRTLALRRRQVVLEQTVEERTEEIQLQKEEIELQQTEILDSISYAKRIQRAILPPDETIEKILPDSFVLYRPKDIVAGDFYWIEQVGDDIFIAAADCTGHGVPGAMVSVVCANALNQAVLREGIYDPGKILDKVTEIVVEQFKKGSDKVKDGMDIALCKWNKEKAEVEFAGAHNPLWLFNESSETPVEYKANKQPVGQFDAMVDFTTHKVEVKKGDRIYLFSDGFADQFGGPKGKKFKTANLKRLFASLSGVKIQDQKEQLEEAFEEWKGSLEQLDDVCVIGIKI